MSTWPVHVLACGYSCEVLPGVANMSVASSFGLLDGDLAVLCLLAL